MSHPPRGGPLGLAGCHACGKVSPESLGRCPRCGTHLHIRKPNSIQRTVALLIAATVLYVPAMALPIMTVLEFGGTANKTIIAGMMEFWESGAYPIAIVIFTASILIPMLKIVALVWLCAAATGKVDPSPKILGKVYWLTELLGRWSMVDIFVVAILVAMVQLGAYMRVLPGPGALAFGGVVILTMFAAMNFDPRLLWDQLERMETPPEKEESP
ncbi:paraquat-inducible protein A [Luteolibacter sp. SL250]|uniref:paraquat-inducible protein A n=1 Tax=Luteolibacter sp. SL250 TaxID=2995170 RepID=UPI00227190B5|nr:paraquat-inducible protein A [Luteolibacter sp. SL250]WAC18715.1 paraquat-inducible protein A [Luteolibacter sp. SL250]